MIGYPYIEKLFKNILKHSAGIAGRVLLCPKMGREIMADDLYQVIQDYFTTTQSQKKYPLALVMPPVGFGEVNEIKSGWKREQIVMFFLKQSYQEGVAQTATMNPNTRTSMHSVTDDWHDMERCATDFVEILNGLIKRRRLFESKIRMATDYQYKVSPVSEIGSDRLAGVRIEFFIEINAGCEIEDYNDLDYSQIELPADDPHPIHSL